MDSDNVRYRERKLEETQWKSEHCEGQLDRKGRQSKVSGPVQRRKNRRKCKNPSKAVRCTFWNGSAWSTEKKMRMYEGKFGIIFEVGRRMRRK